MFDFGDVLFELLILARIIHQVFDSLCYLPSLVVNAAQPDLKELVYIILMVTIGLYAPFYLPRFEFFDLLGEEFIR